MTVNSSGQFSILPTSSSASNEGKLVYNGITLAFDGSTHRYIEMGEDNDSNGNQFYITAGASKTGGTADLYGGNLLLQGGPGVGTGNGGDIIFKVANPAGSTGNSANVINDTCARFRGEDSIFELHADMTLGSTSDKTTLSAAAGGLFSITTDGGGITLNADGDVILDANTGITRFYLAGDTNDYASITVAANGVTTIATFDDGGAVGHLILDPNGDLLLQPSTHTSSAFPIGFTQFEPTFDTTDTFVRFETSGNKAKLTIDDNVTDIHFRFPLVSGNFVCVILQDGDNNTVSNWKAMEQDGSSATLKWAGGTAPANTEVDGQADIASFYWDADNNIAYGTYTYNF